MAARQWWQERLYPAVAQGLLLETVYETRSRYQHIVIAQHEVLGKVLILDGVVQISETDACVYQEMMAHIPLMGLAEPARRVLIVGGGDGAIAREVLRHPEVQKVVMVELDQVVVEACRSLMPGICCDYADPRMELVIQDAAEYVQHAPDGQFDAVIVDSPDPIGPAEVLFSTDFYTDIRRIMSARGGAVFQSGVPFYQKEETARIGQRLRQLFSQVRVYQASVPTYIGGAMALTLASNDAHDFSHPRADFTGRYYNAALHAGAFALPAWWQEELLG
jgi:spermidine synthase